MDSASFVGSKTEDPQDCCRQNHVSAPRAINVLGSKLPVGLAFDLTLPPISYK
jgi:hypothetical protein